MVKKYGLLFIYYFPLMLSFCQTSTSIDNDLFTKKERKQDLKAFIKKNQLCLESNNNGIAVSAKDLPCDCHVQGLGWVEKSNQIVLTCQDKCTEKEGAYLLLYDGNNLLPIDIQKGKSDAFFNHPSAIQIVDDTFPVAFAAERKEDSFIEFYQIKENQLKLASTKTIQLKGRHIGALAYATIGEETYLLGVGWDAEDLTIWKAKRKNATTGFSQHFYTTDSKTLLKKRARKKWGPYNSLWLGTLSDGAVILMGTHGKSRERFSSLDIWRVIDIAGTTPSLKWISSKMIKGKAANGINFFHEGVTIKTKGSNLDSVSLIAAPHDLTAVNCPSGYRCANKIYEFKAY